MSIKGSFWIFLVAITFVSAQRSMVSTDVQLWQIVGVLTNREVVIKDTIGLLQAKIAIALAATPANAAVNAELTKVSTLLNDFVTVSTYGQPNTSLTCDEVLVKASKVLFEIQFSARINVDVVVNNTKVACALGALNTQFVINFYSLTADQRVKYQAVITYLYILIDNYNQYSIAIALAIFKYSLVYVDLLFMKTSLCVCPTKLSTTSAKSLTDIDLYLKQIQMAVDEREASIRNVSISSSAMITTMGVSIKANAALTSVSVTLDTIKNLMVGYSKTTTAEVINATVSCDDAALKLAFIEHKIMMYNHATVEASINASAVLVQIAYLTGYYYGETKLTSAQKTDIQSLIINLNNIVETMRQDILTLVTAIVKLWQLWFDARLARYGSCNCTDGAVPGTIETLNFPSCKEQKGFLLPSHNCHYYHPYNDNNYNACSRYH